MAFSSYSDFSPAACSSWLHRLSYFCGMCNLNILLVMKTAEGGIFEAGDTFKEKKSHDLSWDCRMWFVTKVCNFANRFKIRVYGVRC